MSAHGATAAPAGLAAPVRIRAGRLRVRAAADTETGNHAALRLVAVLGVGGFALVRWLNLAGATSARAIPALLAAALAGGGLLATRRVTDRLHRIALRVTLLVTSLAIALLAAGVPLRLLWPKRWGSLATRLGDGISSLPGVNVPYIGANVWVRVALVGAGALLLVMAAVAASWPSKRGTGSRAGALVVLTVLFAVPAIELTGAHPWLSGSVFAIGVLVILHLEKLSTRRAPIAAAALAAATAAAALVAPQLDRGTPIIDVQALASRLQATATVAFNWNQRYGPLRWPRDGREVLRVRAPHLAYWKTETLDLFNGTEWRARSPQFGFGADTEIDARHPDWIQTIEVTLGAMRSKQFPAAGTVLRVDHAPRHPVPGTAGAFVSDSTPLSRGDAYQATVYTPRPSVRELTTAGLRYPPFTNPDLQMVLPAKKAGDPPVRISFPAFGSGDQPTVYTWHGIFAGRGYTTMAASPYASMFALAQRLALGATSPYAYVQAVKNYLSHGFTYDENPPRHKYALPAFLFKDKFGYCQQFSGAMALLLRMRGVPARVAAGFSPGEFDHEESDYVIRDLDAHSWVEAYFPGLGWVTFDPTPPAAPARAASINDIAAAKAATGNGAKGPALTSGARADVVATSTSGGGLSPLAIIFIVLAVLFVAGFLVILFVGRRPKHAAGVDPELAELQRALRRAARPARPGTTLRDLEHTVGINAGAEAYLRALRDARYAGRPARPTASQRRALRRALADGLGTGGRLRALWALPPRPGWPFSGRLSPGRGVH